MMAQLLEALPPTARLVLLGDKDQLASVEAGAVMGDLCEGAGVDSGADTGGYTPATQDWVREVAGQELPAPACGSGSALAQQTVLLRRTRRFDGPIGELARAFNAGDAAQALALLRSGEHAPIALHPVATASELLEWAVEGRAGVAGGYRGYLERLRGRPEGEPGFQAWAQEVLRRFDEMRVLAVVREGPWGVAGLNAGIEQALAEAGLLSPRGPWYEGRPIIVTRNDPALGVFNGDVGVVLRGPAGDTALRAYFLAGAQLRSVAVSRLAHVQTAFALTVHKSQGSEFAHVMLVLPQEDVPVLTRELVYTAVTRASSALTVVARHPELLATAARRRTRRVSGLPSRLRA
jgi:exodeoxyribonuclease V alpha subunit